MAWTQEDSMKMDEAAAIAEKDLRERLNKLKEQDDNGKTVELSAKQLLTWWHKHLMAAGHKRLYKIADRLLP